MSFSVIQSKEYLQASVKLIEDRLKVKVVLFLEDIAVSVFALTRSAGSSVVV